LNNNQTIITFTKKLLFNIEANEKVPPKYKLEETGIKIDTIIGDAAYSEKGNIELAVEENIKLVAKLNPSVIQRYR